MACLQRRGGRVRVIKENHFFSDFESEQLSLVSEAFSFLSSLHSPLTLLYLGGFETNTVKGMEIHFSCL